ncbi:cell death abnormality protein 1-like [Mya arenaria]|uniref:cell death abnormality protein 1-like n=1 Tax=Mya arenaria TaxID=6604 RepID=UPI0022E6DFC4|nr:cell death abnormality protein 1-like [Mya arenaria]XP_052763969.1 cell death abnormality protein 1-like [Mya arenaria]
MKSLILVLLWATSCSTVTVLIDGVEVDCSLDCVCCQGGEGRCGYASVYGDNVCFDGCVDGIYGSRCHNPCPGNCNTCEQIIGRRCYSCQDIFYDTDNFCYVTCSVGYDEGTCNDNGTCRCKANFEGSKCDICIPGSFGTDCSNVCDHKNCICTTGSDCTSCKKGFNDKSTFCQTPCSRGCLNGVCNDDGGCKCLQRFADSLCSECISGYYGVQCDIPCPSGCMSGTCMENGTCYKCVSGFYGERCKMKCSDGCSAGLCTIDGTCTCRVNLNGNNCETCTAGKYENNCQHVCSVSCSTTFCDRSEGYCSCLPNFSGNKCDTCTQEAYGLACDLHCSDKCIDGMCSRLDGACIIGCVDGYSGIDFTETCNLTCATCQQYDESYCEPCFNEYSGSTCICPKNCACEEGSDSCTSCVNMYSNLEYQCKCHTKYCKGNNCNFCINSTYYVHEGLESCCPCSTFCKDAICSSQHQCLNGCENGMYGNDCSKKCSDLDHMCQNCTQVNGVCTKCSRGFYHDFDGHCIACSPTCIGSSCNSTDGRCLAGCIDGHWGESV